MEVTMEATSEVTPVIMILIRQRLRLQPRRPQLRLPQDILVTTVY
jgi:hypothetical protein